MTGKEKVLDDLARIAGGFVSVVNDLGNNIRADLRSRTDEMATRLGLVPREDFERLELMLEDALKKIDQQNERPSALEKKHKKKQIAMTAEFKIPDHDSNPLDNVEDILNANNWVFSRMNEDELVVNVTGKSGQYRLFFLWQEDMRALQFCVQHQINIQPNNMNTARNTVCKINENLWMGHFDLPIETHMPTYRYTCLFRGSPNSIPEIIEDMVDVSMSQCEKFFPVSQLLSGANDLGDNNLNLAPMETAGES